MTQQPQPRVLVVEHDAAIRRVLVRMLLSKGCDVQEAAHAEEGLVAIVRGPYDAVVTDVVMPGMGGEALWRAGVAERPELLGRFVFVSATERPAVPGARYLSKPFDLDELWREVDGAIHRPSG